MAKALQKKDLSAADGFKLGMMTVSTLEELKSNENYLKFWTAVNEDSQKNDIDEPELPRKRKRTAKVAEAKGQLPQFSNVTEYYKSFYFDSLELLTTRINERFNQKGYHTYVNLENLLLKASLGKEDYKTELEFIKNFYATDLDSRLLEAQLLTFTNGFRNFKTDSNEAVLKDIINFMKQPGVSSLLSEVSTILKLILVLPATNAQSERVFSTLHIIKDYL